MWSVLNGDSDGTSEYVAARMLTSIHSRLINRLQVRFQLAGNLARVANLFVPKGGKVKWGSSHFLAETEVSVAHVLGVSAHSGGPSGRHRRIDRLRLDAAGVAVLDELSPERSADRRARERDDGVQGELAIVHALGEDDVLAEQELGSQVYLWWRQRPVLFGERLLHRGRFLTPAKSLAEFGMPTRRMHAKRNHVNRHWPSTARASLGAAYLTQRDLAKFLVGARVLRRQWRIVEGRRVCPRCRAGAIARHG
jgi:hypothetical protein